MADERVVLTLRVVDRTTAPLARVVIALLDWAVARGEMSAQKRARLLAKWGIPSEKDA